MACVEKVKHQVDHCTSEKGLQVFYDDARNKYTGYCFSCAAKGLEAYVENPYEGGAKVNPPKKKTEAEIREEIEEIRQLKPPTFTYRGIPKEYFKRSGVKLAYSEYDGETPNSFNFPFSLKGDLIGYKTILIDKKVMWSVGNIKGADLYNWEVAKKKGTKRLYITEGEWDCHALEYMLEKASGGKYKYAVTSLPHGAGSAASVIGRMRKEIETIFDEIVLVFDFDEAGDNAVKEVQKVIPDVLVAPHVSRIKDANQALLEGEHQTFVDFVLWKARKPPIEGVVTVAQAMSKGVVAPVMGLSYPWPTVTEVMYGQRFGEATCVAGGVGIGKTAILHECGAHNISVHNEPVTLFLLEEDNVKTCWNIAGKIDSLQYNRPEVFEANKERFYETMKRLEDKLFMWNSSGNIAHRFDLPEIISAIRFNNAEYGCRFFDIDNITRIIATKSASEANEFVNKYSSELANLACELDVHIRLYSHLNVPEKGRSHEEGGEVLASQLTGSRGIMRFFPNVIGFERNKMAEGLFKSNSFIAILKNRDYGNEQKIKTQYSQEGRLLEFEWEGDSLY